MRVSSGARLSTRRTLGSVRVATAGAACRARERARSRRIATSAGLTIVATLIAVVMAFPFYWMVMSSLKSRAELVRFPPSWVPQAWRFDNYSLAWRGAKLSHYFQNSMFVAVSTTVFTLFVCSTAAYAFAKLRFKLREPLFWLVVGSQAVPAITSIIPVFIIVRSVPLAGGNNAFGVGGHGWINSYEGLIVPGVGGAFGVFLLRQFFLSLPDELLCAARVDGCSEYRIYAQIVLPLSKPVLATLSIFSFSGVWNDFLWPLLVTTDDRFKTIQLGLLVFRNRFSESTEVLLAGVTIATIPMVLVFLSAQQYFIGGIALTGLKE